MIGKEEIGNYRFRFSFVVDGKSVGFIDIEETIDVINIIDVMVNENNRRQGIASKLLNEIINNYSNVKFMLEVSEDNKAAIELYKKFGFKVIHVRKKYYKTSDALIMEMIK